MIDIYVTMQYAAFAFMGGVLATLAGAMIAYVPIKRLLSPPTEEESIIVGDVYQTLVMELPDSYRENLGALYEVVFDLPLTEVIAALVPAINSDNEPYRLTLSKLITQAVVRHGEEVIPATLELGRTVAKMYNQDLAQFSKDIETRVPAEDPELLMALALVLLYMNELNIESLIVKSK